MVNTLHTPQRKRPYQDVRAREVFRHDLQIRPRALEALAHGLQVGRAAHLNRLQDKANGSADADALTSTFKPNVLRKSLTCDWKNWRKCVWNGSASGADNET